MKKLILSIICASLVTFTPVVYADLSLDFVSSSFSTYQLFFSYAFVYVVLPLLLVALFIKFINKNIL